MNITFRQTNGLITIISQNLVVKDRGQYLGCKRNITDYKESKTICQPKYCANNNKYKCLKIMNVPAGNRRSWFPLSLLSLNYRCLHWKDSEVLNRCFLISLGFSFSNQRKKFRSISTITTIAVREARRDGFKFFPWVFLQKWTLQISAGIDVSAPSPLSMPIDVKFKIVAETAWLHFKTIFLPYS